MTIETIIIGACGVLLFLASSLIDYWMRRAKRSEERADAYYKQRNALSIENCRLRSALSKEQREKLRETETHLEQRRN